MSWCYEVLFIPNTNEDLPSLEVVKSSHGNLFEGFGIFKIESIVVVVWVDSTFLRSKRKVGIIHTGLIMPIALNARVVSLTNRY